MADASRLEPAGCDTRLLLGEVLHFSDDPGDADDPPQAHHWDDGGVLVVDGRVRACGARSAVQDILAADPALAARVRLDDQRGRLILPGLVDCHMHYPQVGVMASWGRQLLDWLENYTFPAETACADPAVAEARAAFVLRRMFAHGTTTASVFATSHAHSVDAFMAQAGRAGARMLCGKVMMDRNCPQALRDSVEENSTAIPALIARWHGQGRLRYTITPRFAVTSSPQQLALAGELYASHPDLHVQSHLSENAAEIAWVRELYPAAADYFAVYQQSGLEGARAIYGHCLHLTPRERMALRGSGTAVAFCPTSNLFLGSGMLDAAGLLDEGVAVGLATDIGGGSSLSLIRTLAAAYQHSQFTGHPLTPLRLWYLATLGGARALALDGMIGSFLPGREADLVVIDFQAIPELAWRAAEAHSLADRLFALAMLGDERCIHATYLEGRPVAAAGGGA